MNPDSSNALPTARAFLVSGNQSCKKCGYLLAGLDSDGVCPECGCPVAESLRGDLLQFASREYLQSVFLGHRIVLVGLLVWIVNIFASAVLHELASRKSTGWQQAASLLVDCFGIALSALLFYGHIKITTPDPQYVGERRPDRSRAWVRGAAVAMIAGSVVATFHSYALRGLALAGWVETLADWSWGLGLIVLFFAMMHYERWLARRVPDAALVWRSRLYEWLLPVISVGLCCALFIGPIASLILYWLLLNRMRKHLQSIVLSGVPARLPGVVSG